MERTTGQFWRRYLGLARRDSRTCRQEFSVAEGEFGASVNPVEEGRTFLVG